MTIQGLIGTGDLGTNAGVGDFSEERPYNWRQGILMRYPNGHAPITALTSAMKKKVTDDPQYHWWEREISNLRFELGEDVVDEDPTSTWTIVADPFGFSGGDQLKVNDILLVEQSGELVRVTAITSNTIIVVARDFGGTVTTPNFLFAGADVNPYLLLVGHASPEGADTPESIRYRPTKHYNYTQIFRNSLKATRTAINTRLRTVDEVRDAKQQALLYHSVEMEYAFLHGKRVEETDSGSGQPRRATGGIVSFIPSANVVAANANGGQVKTMFSQFEAWMMEAFRWGSNEKMAFLGNRALLTLNQMARYNSAYELMQGQKEYGMDIRSFLTPFGTLVCKMHPLFNQVGSQMTTDDNFWGMDSWCLVLDMANITYRPLKGGDTSYLPDRQGNGIDGITSEYLTECGLEVNHGKTHYLIKGMGQGGVVDS